MRTLVAPAFVVSAVVLAVLIGCGPTGRDVPPAVDDEVSADSHAPAVPGDLTASTWRLEALGAGAAAASPIAGTEVSVTFTADGRISGTGGCNRFFGTYESGEGGSLTFSPLGATRMACPPEIMSQEDSFFVALGRVTSFAIEDDRLSLAAGDEGRVVRFVAVEETDDGP